jgi:two-component system cell cycle sensor histidine kinase/response regulator CckA
MNMSRPQTIRLSHRLAMIFLSTGCGMAAYEASRTFCLPGLAPWVSHSITIAFTTILATVAAYFAFRKVMAPSRVEQDQWVCAEQIISHATEGILTINQRGQVLALNPAAEKLFGYHSADVLNQPITKLLTEAPAHERQSLLRDTLPAGSILGLAAGAREVIGKRKTGDTFPLELTGSSVKSGDESVSVAFVRDVSKRKRAQRYLLAHYAATCVLAEASSLADALPRILQALCEALHCEAGAYWRVDADAAAVTCADVYQAPFASLPSWPNTAPLSCTTGRGLPGRVWSTGRPAWVEELLGAEDCPCQVLADALHLHAGFGFPVLLGQEVCGVVTLFNCRKQKRDQQLLDIMMELGKQLGHFVARKRDEEMLRETTQTLQALVQAAPVGIHIVDLEGKVRLWNPAAERIFGWSAEEVLGQALPVLQVAEDQTAGDECLIAHDQACHGLPIRCPTKHGGVIEVSLSTAPLVDSAGTVLGVMGIRMDLTEQKKLEDQLRQAQKMEAVGQLAGGVAHDFNNLLTVITGYSEVLLNNLKTEESSRVCLNEIQKAGQRAAELTRQLLAFSRKQILQPRLLDLNDLVADMQKMLGRLIGEDIQLFTTLARGLGHVQADPGQIEQILVNLVVNARDAMPRGGRLTIETADIQVEEAQRQDCPELRPGRYARLAVTDTGCGMDAQTLARIFEPFFTTKDVGKGTGLGLATVYGIVKQSGGQVRASSKLGKGSRFEVYLPVVKKAAACEDNLPVRVSPPGGTETILLAEDEDGVRALVGQVLRSKGYTILEATNGEDALRLSEENQGPVDLLLTDVVMPHVGGRALAEAVAARYPDAKVLYMSGYTDDAVLRNGVLQSENEFLQKPFNADDLLYKVRELLDKNARGTGWPRKTQKGNASYSTRASAYLDPPGTALGKQERLLEQLQMPESPWEAADLPIWSESFVRQEEATL